METAMRIRWVGESRDNGRKATRFLSVLVLAGEGRRAVSSPFPSLFHPPPPAKSHMAVLPNRSLNFGNGPSEDPKGLQEQNMGEPPAECTV